MFRYVVALMLVSFYSKSSGAPTNGSGTDLSVLLKNLASTCENPFLSAQITSKIIDCHVLVPPYDEKKFQCMLFYDINKQLCTKATASKLAINEDYSKQILQEQDVVKLCSAAKDWSFTELGEVYKKYVNAVFNNSIRCARVCSADNNDIFNVDSNYYCKYYKWGVDMLKTQIVTDPTQSGSAVGAPVHLSGTPDEVTKKPETPVVSAQSGPDIKVKDPLVPKPVVPKPVDPEIAVSHVAADSTLSTSDSSKPLANEGHPTKPESSVPEINPNNVVAPSSDPVKPDTTGNKGVADTIDKVSEVTQNNQIGQLDPEKIPETSSDANKQSDKPKTNSQVAKPNDIADPDDYPNEFETDDITGGLSDNQGGDDGDDPSVGEADLKGEKKKLEYVKKIETSLSQINVNDISQKDYYASDGFSEDGDDHFFSFFLTATILVVLFYILYHNKSKVIKVFMGLIVEGRQPGRRRNSRGHAYKRLDTLEQAMSASSAAPPSKIIY